MAVECIPTSSPAGAPSPWPAVTVLVAHAHAATRAQLAALLARAGYGVRTAAPPSDARAVLDAAPVDALVLGLTAADGAVLALCAAAKARAGVPVLLCTRPGQKALWALGLRFGADDFVSVPVDGGELEVRLETALHRAARERALDTAVARALGAAGAREIRVGGLLVRPAAREVLLDGAVVSLTPTEYRLLHRLAAHADAALSRERLARRVWDDPDAGLLGSLDVHVRRLRAKLRAHAGPTGPRIVAVRGYGYRLVPAPRPAPRPRAAA